MGWDVFAIGVLAALFAGLLFDFSSLLEQPGLLLRSQLHFSLPAEAPGVSLLVV